MKLWTYLTSLGVAAGICVFALSAQAGAPKHSILNSKHNVNNVFGANTIMENQVCLPCHAPHNQPDQTQDFLWNHVPSTYGSSYTMYPSTANYDTNGVLINNTIESGVVVGLDSTSMKCLSCHDGSVAIDAYGAYQFSQTATVASTFNNATGSHTMSGAWQIGAGGDLSHNHPIGVTYPGLDATGKIFSGGSFNDPTKNWSSSQYQAYNSSNVLTMFNYVDAGSTGPGIGTQIYTVGGGFSLATVGGNSNVVGCGTCHTPHSDNYNFLVIRNTNSQLCLTCHQK